MIEPKVQIVEPLVAGLVGDPASVDDGAERNVRHPTHGAHGDTAEQSNVPVCQFSMWVGRRDIVRAPNADGESRVLRLKHRTELGKRRCDGLAYRWIGHGASKIPVAVWMKIWTAPGMVLPAICPK